MQLRMSQGMPCHTSQPPGWPRFGLSIEKSESRDIQNSERISVSERNRQQRYGRIGNINIGRRWIKRGQSTTICIRGGRQPEKCRYPVVFLLDKGARVVDVHVNKRQNRRNERMTVVEIGLNIIGKSILFIKGWCRGLEHLETLEHWKEYMMKNKLITSK